MRNIYIVTHAESVHHRQGKVGGWYDTGLTEKGRQQAGAVAARMVNQLGQHHCRVVSSDLLRAHETASIIAGKLGCELHLDQRLREFSYGVAEGKPQAWLDERISPAPDADRLDHLLIDGAESKRAFVQRAYDALDAVIENENRDQIVVTHRYTLTFLIARWIGLPLEDSGFVNFHATSAGITHLQQDTFWRNRSVVQVNDLAHLN